MRIRLLCLAALAPLGLAACGTTLFEPTAATVNGHKITVEQIDAAGERFAATPRFEELAKDGKGDEIRRQFEQSYLSQLISHEVITAEAEEEGIEVTDEEVEKQIASIQENFGGEDAFNKAIADQGIEQSQLPGLVKDQLLEQELRKRVTADIEVSDAELQDYYDQHIGDYRQVRVSHILVKKKPLAQRLANELQQVPKAQLKDRFATLAKQNSEDPGSAPKGGDLGLGPTSKYVPEFAKAVEALDLNEVSDPVKSEFGYHVILVTKRVTAPFAQVRSSIEAQLAGPQADKIWGDWIKEAYEDAEIKVNPRYGELDVETRRVVDTPDEDVPGSDGGSSPSAPSEEGSPES